MSYSLFSQPLVLYCSFVLLYAHALILQIELCICINGPNMSRMLNLLLILHKAITVSIVIVFVLLKVNIAGFVIDVLLILIIIVFGSTIVLDPIITSHSLL